MVVTALFFDVLQWAATFVFLHWAVTIFAYMTFGLWFFIKGIKLLTSRRIATVGGTLIIEIAPFIAALPAITAMVVITILDAKARQLADKAMGNTEDNKDQK